MPNPRFGDSEPEVVSIAGACALLDQEAQEVIDRYDLGIETLDLLVPSRAVSQMNGQSGVWLYDVPGGTFVPVDVLNNDGKNALILPLVEGVIGAGSRVLIK